MKIKNTIAVVLLFLLSVSFLFTACTFWKIIRYNFSGIEDHAIFPGRRLKASRSPFYFAENLTNQRIPESYTDSNGRTYALEDLTGSNGTVAFLIIKDDTLLLEKYSDRFRDSSISLSFSMAKSFSSILIGCAIEDGYLRSVDQPITDFVPELLPKGFERVTIKLLLQMTSGMDYTESDNPFSIHVHFYYGSDLEKRLINLKLKEEPGRRFEYKSGDNQLLGLILSRVLRPKTITGYMQDRIWEPLGMEYDGLWNIDHGPDGMEKTFCCVAARARDYAKLGRLYLNYGYWNGVQILPRSWIEQSTRVDTTEGSAWNYQYQWWLVSKDNGDYLAAGHLGQYLYVHPKKQLIIVRLGKNMGNFNSQQWQDLFVFLSNQIH